MDARKMILIALLGAGMFINAIDRGALGVAAPILSEVAPKGLGGTLTSAINTVSSIAGIMAPTVTGFIYQFTGSFQVALLIAGLRILISACSILFIVPEIRPINLRDETQELKASVVGQRAVLR